MTLEQARKDIANHKMFADLLCINCSANDWYCTDQCNMVKKMYDIPLEKLQKIYAKHDGDNYALADYIKQYHDKTIEKPKENHKKHIRECSYCAYHIDGKCKGPEEPCDCNGRFWKPKKGN